MHHKTKKQLETQIARGPETRKHCILRQRLKVENEECPHCKTKMNKVLFSSKKDDSLRTNKAAICDPFYGIYYENAECKKFI